MSDQTFSINDLLGLLADDLGRAEPNDDARNVAAAALVAAFTGPLEEFSVRRAILLPNWQPLEARAREAAGGRLPIEGWITEKPWLALCARVQEFGFGNADVATGHRLLFAMLVELLSRTPESSRQTLATVASGLRLLIERHYSNPIARPQPPISSAWGLFSWIEGHTQIKQYVKAAWRKCTAAAANALVTSDLAWGTNAGDDEAGLEPTPLGVLEGIDIWQIPLASGHYEFNLPEDVEQTCLAKCLTRVASLSRFTTASPLHATNREMQDEVAVLLTLARSSDPASAQCRRAVASLLSIATGTPLELIPSILWTDARNPVSAFASYPGMLTDDARWLIRSEYNPREQATGTFIPRAIHIPIPPSLAPHLLRQKPADAVGQQVIADTPAPHSRRQSVWATTLFGALARNRVFGISMAQHVLCASHGLDDAPVHYDRIGTDTIAHAIASVTHPWFGDKPRPPVEGMPRHYVGSARGRQAKEVRELMRSLQQGFNDATSLCGQVSRMAIHLLHGLVIASAMRINGNMADITLRQISLTNGIATLSDKPVPGQSHRLVAIPQQVVTGLQAYLKLLEVAKEALPGTTLATCAALALNGEGPLFLQAAREDDVRSLTDHDYLASLPRKWAETPNWARHTMNQSLSGRLPVHLRVAQMGWVANSMSAISELASTSAIDALEAVRKAVADAVREMGWQPIRTGHGLAEVPVIPVHWLNAQRTHAAMHRTRVRGIKERMDTRLAELAGESEARINAFLDLNRIQLQMKRGRIERTTEAMDQVAVSRDIHAALRQVVAGGRQQSQQGAAPMLVYKLMKEARDRGVTSGPLPNKVVAEIPRDPGDFIAESPHVLDHVTRLWEHAVASDIAFDARIFLTILIHGGIASIPLALACMDPRARTRGLEKDAGSILLVQPPEELASGNGRATGTVAFTGPAALALRAWHRPRKVAPAIDEARTREETLRLYKGAFGTSIGIDEVLEEVEAMVRAANALTMPGIIRQVAMGNAYPSFARIERVVALHSDAPIAQRPEHQTPKRLMSAATVGQKMGKSPPATYRALTKILRTATQEDMRAGYAGLKAKVRSLGDGKPVETFGEVMVLFALALLDGGGLVKGVLALDTIRGRIYAVGRRLTRTMPGQVSLEEPLTWETAYLRVVATAKEEDRPWLVESIRYFHRILCRDYADIPSIQFGPLFDNVAQRQAEDGHSGFLTDNELQASITCSGMLKAQAEAEGSRSDIEEQSAGHDLAVVAASTTLRPREYRAVRVGGVRVSGNRIRVELRSRRDVPLKSVRARRVVKLRGPCARDAAHGVAFNLRRRQKTSTDQRNRSLFQRLDQVGYPLETSSLTGRLNELIRTVTGNPVDDCYLFRKTAALRLFREAMAVKSSSPWPTIEVLAEMGQAEPATLVNYYIHDPVTLLLMPRSAARKMATKEASWILGMGQVSARRLLNKHGTSWLRREMKHAVDLGSSFVFPKLPRLGRFIAEPFEAELAARLICGGESIKNAVGLVGWPRSAVEPMRAVLRDLEDSRITLSSADIEGFATIGPPRIDRTSNHFREVLGDRRSWTGMATAFDAWRRLVPLRELEGIPLHEDGWKQILAVTPALATQGWEARKVGMATVWAPQKRPGKQSQWPTWRWLMLATWLSDRISTLSTSQGEKPEG